MIIQFKKVHPNAQIPAYQTAGSAAFDLACVEDADLAPGEIRAMRSGLVFQIPHTHTLLLVSRSSNPKKKGIALPHGVGVIDSDYAGPQDEVHILVQNITSNTVTLHAGDRIAQGLILPIMRAQFEENEQTHKNNRGGFGSTGQ